MIHPYLGGTLAAAWTGLMFFTLNLFEAIPLAMYPLIVFTVGIMWCVGAVFAGAGRDDLA